MSGPRRPWSSFVLDRLATYEQIDGALDLNTIIRSSDYESACRALRGAKLNPASCTRVPQPPDDAPDLDLKLNIGRPPRDSPDTYVLVQRCLRGTGSERAWPAKTCPDRRSRRGLRSAEQKQSLLRALDHLLACWRKAERKASGSRVWLLD